MTRWYAVPCAVALGALLPLGLREGAAGIAAAPGAVPAMLAPAANVPAANVPAADLRSASIRIPLSGAASPVPFYGVLTLPPNLNTLFIVQEIQVSSTSVEAIVMLSHASIDRIILQTGAPGPYRFAGSLVLDSSAGPINVSGMTLAQNPDPTVRQSLPSEVLVTLIGYTAPTGPIAASAPMLVYFPGPGIARASLSVPPSGAAHFVVTDVIAFARRVDGRTACGLACMPGTRVSLQMNAGGTMIVRDPWSSHVHSPLQPGVRIAPGSVIGFTLDNFELWNPYSAFACITVLGYYE